MQLAAAVTLCNFKISHLDYRYAHLLPKDEEAFDHYNLFSSKRLEEVSWF